MIAVFIIGFIILFSLATYDEHYHDKQRADRAKRAQARIIEARKGYRNLGELKR